MGQTTLDFRGGFLLSAKFLCETAGERVSNQPISNGFNCTLRRESNSL